MAWTVVEISSLALLKMGGLQGVTVVRLLTEYRMQALTPIPFMRIAISQAIHAKELVAIFNIRFMSTFGRQVQKPFSNDLG